MTESGNDNNDSANSGTNDNGQGAGNDPASESGKSKTITLTQEELDRMFSERVNKLNSSWEKKWNDRVKADEDKAALEKLQGEEKLKKQHQLEVEKLQQERDTYSKALRIARAEASLSAKGLDPQFASQLVGASDEETSKNIDSFAKMVDAQVAKTIKANTQKGAPPAPNSSESDPMKDAIYKGFGVQ